MRRALLSNLVCSLALLALPAGALAAGPVIQGGMLRTALTDQGGARYGSLDGGGYKVGFEVGSHRWRSEWAFNQNILTGYNEALAGNHRLSLTGFSYQLTFLFRETGLTPYVGLGAEMGVASFWESGYDFYQTNDRYSGEWSDNSEGVYLRPYGIAGLRLQFGFGLAIRAELTASYYYEFFGVGTNLGISYTW